MGIEVSTKGTARLGIEITFDIKFERLRKGSMRGDLATYHGLLLRFLSFLSSNTESHSGSPAYHKKA